MKHSPGPWKIKQARWDDAAVEIVAESGQPIAVVYWFGFDATRNANAALIAAAPELLQELMGVARLHGWDQWDELFSRALGEEYHTNKE